MQRLHRSKRNKVILGVCGGLSEYLHIDPVIIRIVAILALFMGWGFFIYIVAAIIMPEEAGYEPGDGQWSQGGTAGHNGIVYRSGTGPDHDFGNDFSSDADNWDRPARYDSSKTKYIVGIILIGAGIIFLLKRILPDSISDVIFNMKYMLPLLLIAIGGVILYRGRR